MTAPQRSMPRSLLFLIIALVMFPQVVETIYSPALPLIAERFEVPQSIATQTLSFYFLAFALGVLFWGILCDKIGRRPAFLLALSLYTLTAILALLATQFSMLLMARMGMAFAAAIGSIGTQTFIRDQFSGDRLRALFSLIGIALAISPIIGLLLGTGMVLINGELAIFTLLAFMGFLFLLWSFIALPETRLQQATSIQLLPLIKAMFHGKHIWRSALLIAAFNIMLFSYYQLAPFLFEALQLPASRYGLSGFLLGGGTFIGAFCNQYLIKRGVSGERLIQLAIYLAFLSSLALKALESHWSFILPMLGIMMAYSIAIPNILATALKDYQHALGSAGAILGLFYYSLIGLGLIIAGMMPSLGLLLILVSLFAWLVNKLSSIQPVSTRLK